MDYGQLIRDAWTFTWRYRFLWVLGLFAGGAGGFSGGGPSMQWQTDRRDLEQMGPAMAGMANQAAAWLAANVGLIVGLAIFAAALGIAALILSLIAQGGMARATADIATGTPSSLGRAWSAGLHFFWRYVGMWLLLVAATAVLAALVAALIATGVMTMGAADPAAPRTFLGLVLVLLAIPLVLLGIAAGVVVSIVIAYAQRAIAVEDVGPLAALQSGWRLFRAHLGTSLLVWLINLALGIASGILIAIAAISVLLPLGIVGAIVWAIVGEGVALVSYVALAIVGFIAAILTVVAIANTFFWNYWTLAYLRLGGGAGGHAAA